jgi:pyridoxine 4-dehydrogenase
VTGADLTGRIALGGAGFSITADRDDDAAIAVIRAAYDAGIRTFDSARAYAPVGEPLHNELLFRRALAGCDDAVIGTKGGHWRAGTDDWRVDNRAARLRSDVDDSLRALGVDRLPLYYVHRVDLDAVHVEESVQTLDDLRRQGKIDRIGISNVTAEQVRAAAATAPVAAVQNRLSVREVRDAEVLAEAERLGIAVFGYSPLRAAPSAPDLASALPRLAALADDRGVPLERLALRGLLASSPSISLIVGAGRIVTAREGAAAEGEAWDSELDAAYAADRGLS